MEQNESFCMEESMAVYEVTRKDIQDKITEIFNKYNVDDQSLKEELIKILSNNELPDCEFDEGDSFIFDKKTPSQLYLRDSRYHIRIKDIVIAFVEDLFLKKIINVITGISDPNMDIGSIIILIKKIIKDYVVKLDESNYCIYLQAITHLSEHKGFTCKEIIEWLPKYGGKCNMHSDNWTCPYRENDLCIFDINNMDGILHKMIDKRIFVYAEGDKTYKINY